MPLRSEVIHGTPVRANGSVLVPVIRIRTLRFAVPMPSARWAFTISRARPIAIIERNAGSERRHPVSDPTTSMLRWMAMAAIGILAIALLVRRILT
jgi:hypothetical protein